jgi:hypothetical protein
MVSVENYAPPGEKLVTHACSFYGLKDFCICNYKKGEILAPMFLELTFLDWRGKVDQMNSAIEASKVKCKRFSYEEFLIGLGLLVEATEFSQKKG